MKQHPILFSAPMVRAILDGTKTQTRRIVKFPADFDGKEVFSNHPFGLKYSSSMTGGVINRLVAKWKAGDQLWVKETFAKVCYDPYGTCDGENCPYCEYDYRADKPKAKYPGDWPNDFEPHEVPQRWKPSLFMPREASRIWLEVLDVRVERLQEISDWDSIEEGVEMVDGPDGLRYYGNYGDDNADTCLPPKESYRTLWQHINGPESWTENPWVWVITFKKIDHANP